MSATRSRVVALLALTVAARAGAAQGSVAGKSFFVAPAGIASNEGTRQRPRSLAAALANADGRVQPGDTIWLMAGTYVGDFRNALRGTRAQPITVAAVPGVRATIDGRLNAYGAYTIFRDFEVTRSQSDAHAQRGIDVRGPGHRFVNLVVHGTRGSGIGSWMEGSDGEIYGCLIYDNGSASSLDHGIYAMNRDGQKTIADNIVFDNFAYGIHVYGGPGEAIRHFTIEGNIAFGNGSISPRDRSKSNLIVGGDRIPADDITITHNVLFYGPSVRTPNVRLGYDRQIENGSVRMTDNVVVGGDPPVESLHWRKMRSERNRVAGENATLTRVARRSASAVSTARPAASSTALVIVRPNRYEAGRANVAVLFPPRVTIAHVRVVGLLKPGDHYVIHRADDFFGAPVESGVYAGEDIVVLRAAVVAAPRAAPGASPDTSASDIGALVLQRAR